ncbi:hypothetical protein [Photobacterium kishitanii]|uniref:Lipoprotein n=1 Tax=Photobacterium kishitanii TaxID=318456 RepID=A0A2T3KL04_9GAMM|nr:hypothetical protein [Photobacterium kishitanii]PSV00330.1 hypothetical protein C9J27_04180 [Photobacterium kishitanii]
MKKFSLIAATIVLSLSGCASNGSPSIMDQVSTAASAEADFFSQAFGVATGNDDKKAESKKSNKSTNKDAKKSEKLHPMTADEVNALLKNGGKNKGVYTSDDLLNKMRGIFN